MARALRERDRCYAASTYAMYDAFITEAMRQGKQNGREPRLYKNLRSPPQFNASLEADDPAWGHIEQPDETGERVACSL